MKYEEMKVKVEEIEGLLTTENYLRAVAGRTDIATVTLFYAGWQFNLSEAKLPEGRVPELITLIQEWAKGEADECAKKVKELEG
jgi:hypothetical protein